MAQCDQNIQASLCWAMDLSNWGKGCLGLAQEAWKNISVLNTKL